MSRILLIELRRSAAGGAALILLALGALALYAVPQNWSAGWMALALNQREYLAFLFPLALAAGAWQARREKRSKVAELFATTPRPIRQRVLPILGATGLAAAGSYLTATAVAVPRIFDTSADYLPAAALGVVAVGALSLVVGVWVGLALGRLVPTVVTAPALAIGYMALPSAFFALGDKYDWLFALLFPDRLGYRGNDYLTIDGGLAIGQALLLAGLAAAAIVLLAARSRPVYASALVIAAVGLAAGVAVVPKVADFEAEPIDPVAREQVCADGTPQICVARVHSGLLPEIAPFARQGLALLAKVPGAPTRVEENTTSFDEVLPPPPKDTVRIRVKVDRDGHLAFGHEIATDMIANAVVGDFEGCAKGEQTAVARAAASVLTGPAPTPKDRYEVEYEPEINKQATAIWEKLKQLPEHEALARLGAVRAAAMACRSVDEVLR